MLVLPNLTSEMKKLEYYLLNSSGGFIVWECNEYASKAAIEKELKKYPQTIFVDILNFKLRKHLSFLNEKQDEFSKQKIYVFENIPEAYSYNNYFDLPSLLMELNFTRDVWAKHDYVYIFIMPTYLVDEIMKKSPSFWDYVSLHVKVPNIIYNPIELKKIKKKIINQYRHKDLVTFCHEHNGIINAYNKSNNKNERAYLLTCLEEYYEKIESKIDTKLLGIVYFNLSRIYYINDHKQEALTFAIKSTNILEDSKSRLNALYCYMNLGYKRIQRKKLHPISKHARYYMAVESLAYGYIDISQRIAEEYFFSSEPTDKFHWLFFELAAALYFLKGEYRSALDIYVQICIMADSIRNDHFIDLDIIENNINIVKDKM